MLEEKKLYLYMGNLHVRPPGDFIQLFFSCLQSVWFKWNLRSETIQILEVEVIFTVSDLVLFLGQNFQFQMWLKLNRAAHFFI